MCLNINTCSFCFLDFSLHKMSFAVGHLFITLKIFPKVDGHYGPILKELTPICGEYCTVPQFTH